MATAPDDLVVLLDEDGSPRGTMHRAQVHGPGTPLHLAFSCYVFDADGRFLVTRRAISKRTWPGVWTNSGCGHPRPGEAPAAAVPRRLGQELGLDLAGVDVVLPDFRYRAVDAAGTVENEVCPVFVARAIGDPAPDAAEVAEWRWVDWDDFVAVALRAPWGISPWAASQVRALDAAGLLAALPHRAAAGNPGGLPSGG